MTTIRCAFLAALGLLGACAGGSTAPADASQGRLGLQLYSLRDLFKSDGVDTGLDRTKALGFEVVELAGTYNLSAAEFAAKLKSRGLKPVSGHFPWDRWKKEPEAVAAEAKALGLEYAGCAWAGHTAPFDEKQAREVIEVFRKAGEATAKVGVRYFYHFHGFEFRKHGDGTLADLIIRETDPTLVAFEMDVLWTWLPNVDPVALIKKYPGRFKLMHIKDMKPGLPRGSLAGGIPEEQKAVIGQGQVNWADVMEAAEADGFEYYYIEDESPDPVNNVPQSITYLERLEY